MENYSAEVHFAWDVDGAVACIKRYNDNVAGAGKLSMLTTLARKVAYS